MSPPHVWSLAWPPDLRFRILVKLYRKLKSCLGRGVVDRVGPAVSKLRNGDKVVVSFQVACGTCRYCQKKLSSMCEKTNNSSLMANMYGQRESLPSVHVKANGRRTGDAGFFGYGHMSEQSST